MNATTFVVLGIAALLTSALSAVLGMAGGVLLLSIMLSFMSHGEAIPTHAAVQMFSNGTRVLVFIRDVDRRAFVQFIAGVIPGGAIGFIVLWTMGEPRASEPYLKAFVGLYVLAATWMPRPHRRQPAAHRWWWVPAGGVLAGAAALTVGAVGPLIAPVFLRADFTKERLIATKACCQLATHVVKIPTFLLLRDLPVTRLGLLALVMIVMVIPGTILGKRVLGHIPEHLFQIMFRMALTIAGLKVLFVDGLKAILFPS